jgi:integrase
VAAVVRYVRERDGVYQYERRVPLAVQRNVHRYAALFGSRPLFRRSLRTKDRGGMLVAAATVHDEFETRLAQAMNRPAPIHASTPSGDQRLTEAELDSIAQRYSDLKAEPFERLILLADTNPGAAAELDHACYELDLHAEQIYSAIHDKGRKDDAIILTPLDYAPLVIEQRGLNIAHGSLEFGSVVGAIRAGMVRGYDRIHALRMGHATPKPVMALARSNTEPKSEAASIRAVMHDYIAFKELPVKQKTEAEHALRQFEEVVGNKSLDQITRHDIIAFIEHLTKQTVGGKWKGSIVRPLGGGTIIKRLRYIKAAIQTAKDRGRYDGPHPADGVNVNAFLKKTDKRIMPDKRRFNADELNAIFRHPWFTGCEGPTQRFKPGQHRLTGSEYWAFVVALYTGCRAAELGGLKLNEVDLDSPTPHIRIRANEYRSVKNGEARCVPIVDALTALGFKAYVDRVKRSGAVRVFPDWKATKPKGAGPNDYPAWSNSRLIRTFNESVVPASLGDRLLKGARREVTFHGFRGSFKAMLARSKVPPAIYNEVVGHSKGEMDDIYIGDMSIEETYPDVRSCSFEGLVIPPRPL